LIENFPYDDNLYFFSVEIAQTPHSDSTRKSFLARDGNYYSFIDFKKEFKHWLTNDLLINLTSQKLINAAYDTIIWQSTKYRAKSNRQEFINNNFEVLRTGLLEILNSDYKHFILMSGLNRFTYEGVEFEQYFNNCGEAKEWIYPVMEVFISHESKKNSTQNSYEFLRTDEGYKLIFVTIRDKKIK
jgi:hypothetical protein